MLKRLVLKNFRSFRSEVVDFDNPTFFVGRNGAGKSNLASVLVFLGDSMSLPFRAAWQRAGGTENLCHTRGGVEFQQYSFPEIRVDLVDQADKWRASYALSTTVALTTTGPEVALKRERCVVVRHDHPEVFFDREGQQFRSSIEGLKPLVDPGALILPLIGGQEGFIEVFRFLSGMRVYSIQPARLRELQESDAGAVLRSDGSNAASVLRKLSSDRPEQEKRLNQFLSTIVPNAQGVLVKPVGKYLELKLDQRWGDDQALVATASDGTLRAIGILAAVFQESTPSLLVIEEPEATIHPGALEGLTDVFNLAARRMQVVVTTHSPELLETKWLEARHLRIVEWQDGESRVFQVSGANQEAIRRRLMSVGELLRSNALEPGGSSERAEPELFETL